jgi:hypothetical protein
LASGVSQGNHGAREDIRPAELDLFSKAQALIERTIGNDNLSAATLAQALKASRGALYGVFAEHGGIQATLGGLPAWKQKRFHR